MVSASCWVRRRSSTGVRSAPPPNHALVVTTKRVFMCTAGTFGFRICAITEMPDAQKVGSSAAPELRAQIPGAADAGYAGMVGAVPGRAHKAPRGPGIERCRRIVFQFLEGRTNVVTQAFEPAPRARLAILDHGHLHAIS